MSRSLNDKSDRVTNEGREASGALSRMLSGGRSFSGNERNCCFLNTGAFPAAAGRFGNISAGSGIDFPDDGRALAVVDWDQDGDLDLWVSNRNAPRLRFLRNNLPSGGHFLAVRLVGDGKSTNRDAIGARVEVVLEPAGDEASVDGNAGDAGPDQNLPLIKTLSAGEGFLSQNSKWLHFGLDSAVGAIKVIVHWPAGGKEEFRDLRADSRYVLTQGTGQAYGGPIASRHVALEATTQKVATPTAVAAIRLIPPYPFTPLPYRTFRGQARQIEVIEGRALLVNLWSTSCRPCLKELSDFVEAQDELRSAGVDVLALSLDQLSSAKTPGSNEEATLQAIGFPFRSGRPNLAWLKLVYESQSSGGRRLPIPTSFLIDRNGKLAVIYKGPVEIPQVLRDIESTNATRSKRFEWAAPLAGRSMDHEVALEALERADAVEHFKRAHVFRRNRLVGKALGEYTEILAMWPELSTSDGDDAAQKANQEKPGLNAEILRAAREIKSMAYKHRGDVSAMIGERRRALEDYNSSIEYEPDNADLYLNRGNVKQRLGLHEEALADYARAIEIQPTYEKPYYNRANVYRTLGKRQLAIEDYGRAIEIKHDYILALTGRANANVELGLYDLAHNDFTLATTLGPESAWSHENFARLLAASPVEEYRNAEKALAHARRSCELSRWKKYSAIAVLAAAYAEDGQFEQAVAAQTKAIKLAPSQRHPELQEQLNLYTAHKPYRLPAAIELREQEAESEAIEAPARE